MLKILALLTAVAAIATLGLSPAAGATSQQSYVWGDCRASVAVSRSSDGRLYGSATLVCNARKTSAEGWLTLSGCGPTRYDANGFPSSSCWAKPTQYSGRFVNSLGFGTRTLINGYYTMGGCVSAEARFTATVAGLGTKTFSSGSGQVCTN